MTAEGLSQEFWGLPFQAQLVEAQAREGMRSKSFEGDCGVRVRLAPVWAVFPWRNPQRKRAMALNRACTKDCPSHTYPTSVACPQGHKAGCLNSQMNLSL